MVSIRNVNEFFGFLCYRFLLQCLTDLDESLKKLNSRLFVIKGQPAEALPKLFRVSNLYKTYMATISIGFIKITLNSINM